MHKTRILRTLIVLVMVLTLLGLLGGPFASLASAHAMSTTRKFDPSHVLGARLLWKYAKHVSAGASGAIPPCLINAVPPRCYSPQQLREAYGIEPLLNQGITGKDRTIVLIDGSTSPTIYADLHLYDQLYGLNDPELNIISPFGPPPVNPSAYVETALDMEIVHALAPDATIDLVLFDANLATSEADFLSLALQATKYAIDNNLGDVISQSYGVGETCASPGYVSSELQVFRAARDQHITVLASSGDSGAAFDVCSSGNSSPSVGQAVPLPAIDPLVTAVGGTTLDADVKTGKYNGEVTWNEWNAGGGATGGGFSTIFPAPDYQRSVPGISTARGIPDVAFDGDPFTGVPIVVSQGGQTIIAPVGGTSVGSPAWAGIVALADQFAGKRLGFLNSALYRILASRAYTRAFHDVTVGNNTVIVPDNQGNSVTIPGYEANPGWDAVTGVGTPRAKSLIPLLVKYVRDGDGNGL
jgi:subtilase family serine protease